MTSQEIFARLQEADGDNKKLWALSQEFESLYRKLSKAQDKVKEASESGLDTSRTGDLLEDKEGLRKAVLEHLFTESERGNAQASDKLAKLAGLGEEKQDIIIEVVQYKEQKRGKRNGTKKGVQSKKVRKGVRSNKVEQSPRGDKK